MASDFVATFFALLLLGGIALTAIGIVRPKTRVRLAESAQDLMAIIAVGATLGSLYFSEVANFIPCELCWAQRIAMYPLGVMLPIAALKKDRSIIPYAVVLAGIGIAISAYHIQLQLFPDQGSMCELNNPCTSRWVEGLGWMTIPQMAGASFALIIALATLTLLTNRTLPTNRPLLNQPETQ